MTRTLLLAGLALSVSAQAQIPDPNSPSAYFPLSVGDEWQYLANGFTVPNPFIARVVEAEVVINDTTYARLRQRTYAAATGAPTSDTVSLLRVDATSGEVRQRTAGADRPAFYFPCPLNVAFPGPDGEPVECFDDDGNVVGFAFGAPADGDGRAFKSFDSLAGGQRVVVGIGLTDFAGDASEGHSLQYARVRQSDGTIYTQGTVIVAGEDAAPTAALAVSASPNPTAGALRLAIEMPTAGALTVEAFDALGRRVYADTRDAAGALDLSLDASGWAPGVYVVRVRMADGVATARVVRR